MGSVELPTAVTLTQSVKDVPGPSVKYVLRQDAAGGDLPSPTGGD